MFLEHSMNMKKTINISLILALVHSLLGCQGMTSTIKRQNDISSYLDKQEKVTITTKDSASYFFNANTYRVIGDSLEGNGQIIIQGKKEYPKSVMIATADIIQVQIQRGDDSGTLVIILVSLGLLVGIVYWVSSSFDKNFF
jgi:hypothetical protein